MRKWGCAKKVQPCFFLLQVLTMLHRFGLTDNIETEMPLIIFATSINI